MGDADQALKAEFDTMATWTADVAVALGPDHYLPAGCRGSGTPGALRWFLDRLAITGSNRMLDCGAGVGGPAAYAAAETGVQPILSEPEAGACAAARRLFGLPVVQAASALPFAAGSFEVVWSLGVLCTVPDQPALLRELRRMLSPDGRLGLLVFVAADPPLTDPPVGNTFPTEIELRAMVAAAGLRIVDSGSQRDYAGLPAQWAERAAAVQNALERQHGDDPGWLTAQEQARRIGRLLANGELVGTLLAAQPV